MPINLDLRPLLGGGHTQVIPIKSRIGKLCHVRFPEGNARQDVQLFVGKNMLTVDKIDQWRPTKGFDQ